MHNENLVKSVGALLAVGAVVFAAGMVLHPPEVPDPTAQQAIVVAQAGAWSLAHWLVTFGALAITVAGLVALAATRLGRGALGVTGWALLTVSFLLFLPVPAIEATVAVATAVAGDGATFALLQTIVFGLLTTLPFVFLGLALVGAGEARAAQAAVPRVLAWLGVAIGGVAFLVVAATLWAGNAAAAGLFNPVALLSLLWLVAYGGTVAARGAPAVADVGAATA